MVDIGTRLARIAYVQSRIKKVQRARQQLQNFYKMENNKIISAESKLKTFIDKEFRELQYEFDHEETYHKKVDINLLDDGPLNLEEYLRQKGF